MNERSDLGVRPLVRHAWHAFGMARTAEAVMLALGAALFAAAAAIASAGEPGTRVVWTVAVLAGLPMGAAWLIEMRSNAAGVARRIDRRLRLGGGLVAAWEVEGELGHGSLGLLLGRELRRKLTLRRVLREALPNSTALIAVPLLGVAALVLALEARPTPVDPLAGMSGVLRGVTEALDEARDRALEELTAGALDLDQVEQMNELGRDARDLAGAAKRMGEDEGRRRAVTEGVRDLAERLERVAQDHRQRPDLAQALERAMALTDAACLACEESQPSAARESPRESPREPSGGATLVEAGDGAGAGGGGEGATGGQDALANRGAEGTMSALPGQEPPVGADSDDPLPAPGMGAAGGVALGPWWPDRHAGVVRRFVERRRGAASSSEE